MMQTAFNSVLQPL